VDLGSRISWTQRQHVRPCVAFRELDLTDDTIHITRWGDSGPRVVLIHGGMQGSKSGGDRHFMAQSQLGEKGWQVLAPDRPGHGRSKAPGRPDDPEADGEWVAQLLGDGAHLVGHSFGGCVALNAAARRPSAVHSLTLIEPAMQNLAADDPRVEDFARKMKEAMTGATSPADRSARFSALVGIPPAIRDLTSPEERTRMGQAIVQLKLPSEETLRKQLRELRKEGVPLLIVTGGWNPAFEAIAAKISSMGGGRHVVVRCDHHIPQLISDEFNQVLADFMNEPDSIARAMNQ